MLFAPQSGPQTRSQIRDMAGRAADAVKKPINNLTQTARSAFEDGKQRWNKEKDRTVDAARDVAHKAGEMMEEGGARLQGL